MKKRFFCTLMCIMLITSTVGCGSTKTESKLEPAATVTEEASEVLTYNIAACLTESNAYNEALYSGFKDCLFDYLSEDAIKLIKYTSSDVTPSDAIADVLIRNHPDLVFTTGKQMLLSMTSATEEIPIIATGIVDFQSVLRIATPGDTSWDKTTGINVSGVSSKPSIVEQVSLMIEATPDLQAVGILFSPEDIESIYQNETFEKYLDQAGIQWKEYSIPATKAAIYEESDQDTSVLSPTKLVAISAKAGADNDVVALGEDILIGLNSPTATRTPLISANWNGGKLIPTFTTESDEASEEIDEESIETFEDEESEPPTLEEMILEACSECSVLYIPFGSMLADQMDTISSICIENNVSTVGGDTVIGQNTLVTLFYDPYALGYSAGKKAIKVLNGADISTMAISSGSSDNSVKLYNGDVAEQMEFTFPKSFKEIHDFLDTYEYGSTTKRKESSEEEQ